jgi:hypothetical protein
MENIIKRLDSELFKHIENEGADMVKNTIKYKYEKRYFIIYVK